MLKYYQDMSESYRTKYLKLEQEFELYKHQSSYEVQKLGQTNMDLERSKFQISELQQLHLD